MKKYDVGIISINIHSFFMNYGAALHSFAFQKYLEKVGIDSVIVDYKSKHIGDYRLDFPFVTAIKRHSSLRHVINMIVSSPSYHRKYSTFHSFYKKNCKVVDNNGVPFNYDFFQSNANKDDIFDFDIVVCESDVIWSPKTSKGFDRVFFCDYKCFNNKLKVAYSPSISNTRISCEEEPEFKRLVSNFDYISCREKETAEYIENLTGKKCTHVLDPVLLLSAEDYEPFIKVPKNENYVLVYNVMKNDKTMLSYAKKFAKEKKLKLIEISDFVINKLTHKTYTGCSIEEFLGLIKKSKYLITNGFHGMCFAILFKKDFKIFARDGFDIKVKSLLDILGMSNVFFDSTITQSDFRIDKIDWIMVDNKLNLQRKISYDYIKMSIEKNIRGGAQQYSVISSSVEDYYAA